MKVIIETAILFVLVFCTNITYAQFLQPQLNIFGYSSPPSRYANDIFMEVIRVLNLSANEISIMSNPYTECHGYCDS